MRRLVSLVFLALLSCAGRQPHDLSFGEHYPHTRWIDRESHSITIDALADRLIVTQHTQAPITIKGSWRGDAFFATSGPIFGINHGRDGAAFYADSRFDRYNFKRVLPDPT